MHRGFVILQFFFYLTVFWKKKSLFIDVSINLNVNEGLNFSLQISMYA